MKIRKQILLLWGLAFCGFPALSMSQVPPPPLLQDQVDLTHKLVAAFADKDIEAYAALLSRDLTVYQDGQVITRNSEEWIGKFRKKLTAPGVVFTLTSGFASDGRLLFVEHFDSTNSWGRETPAHCCWSSDAVAYDIRDGKIVSIHRLRGGSFPVTE